MKGEGKISSIKQIKDGILQECLSSPILFSLFNEIIMKNLKGYPRNKVEGSRINSLRYPDNSVVIAEVKMSCHKRYDSLCKSQRNVPLSKPRK